MARPKLNINAEEVRKLASLYCTIEEIANFFGCSRDTIENRFSAEVSKGKSEGRMSLRRAQIKSALSGNVTMQIWLGKQWLKQTERHEVTAVLPDIDKLQDLSDEDLDSVFESVVNDSKKLKITKNRP